MKKKINQLIKNIEPQEGIGVTTVAPSTNLYRMVDPIYYTDPEWYATTTVKRALCTIFMSACV